MACKSKQGQVSSIKTTDGEVAAEGAAEFKTEASAGALDGSTQIAGTAHGLAINEAFEPLPNVSESQLLAFLDGGNSHMPFDADRGIALLGLKKLKSPEQIAEFDTKRKKYVADCKAALVPIPPSWGDPAWKSKGKIPRDRIFVFDATFDTELWTFETEQGTCAALPRKSAADTYDALGIICQSVAGKACFWDNTDAESSRKITDGKDITVEKISGANLLSENCSECHRGDKAFLAHPGTPLAALPRPTGTYEPVEVPGWGNPLSPPAFAEACQECHSLGKVGAAYCASLLLNSIDGTTGKPTMPPSRKKSEDFVEAIAAIEKECEPFMTKTRRDKKWTPTGLKLKSEVEAASGATGSTGPDDSGTPTNSDEGTTTPP